MVGEKSSSRESVSAFQALMVSTASRVGTGNIVGCGQRHRRRRLRRGVLDVDHRPAGRASAFIESTLAQIYKVRDKNGGSYGGPSLLHPGGAEEPLAGRGLRGGPDRHLRRGVQHAGLLQPDRQHVRIQLYGDPQTSLVPLVGAACWPSWWRCASWAGAGGSSGSPACWSPSWG